MGELLAKIAHHDQCSYFCWYLAFCRNIMLSFVINTDICETIAVIYALTSVWHLCYIIPRIMCCWFISMWKLTKKGFQIVYNKAKKKQSAARASSLDVSNFKSNLCYYRIVCISGTCTNESRKTTEKLKTHWHMSKM